jgi:hypothetical protein
MIIDPSTLDLKQLIDELPKKIDFNISPPNSLTIKGFTLNMLRGPGGAFSVAYFWDRRILKDKEGADGRIEMQFGAPTLHEALSILYNALVTAGYIK